MDVYEALAWVQRELTAVAKTTKQGGPKWAFRGIDDVYNALHPLLGEAGLIITGQAETFHTEDHYWSKGTPKEKMESKAVVMVRFRVFASDGSRLPKSLCPLVPAEGVDNSDKGTGKAWSYAYKTAISSMFSLPTDDPDQNNEQRQGPSEESGWWDLWPSKAAHDDWRSENMTIMRKVKKRHPEQVEEIKQWMQKTGLMSEDGRVLDKIAKAAMAAWSERLADAVTDAATPDDSEASDQSPPEPSDGQTGESQEAPDPSEQLITQALMDHGPLTSAEIAEELKIPLEAVTKVVDAMKAAGTLEADTDEPDMVMVPLKEDSSDA